MIIFSSFTVGKLSFLIKQANFFIKNIKTITKPDLYQTRNHTVNHRYRPAPADRYRPFLYPF